ncbi:neurogenic locus notch homolog protein 1-like [Mya arenaria]|uniref:neurogenic locus notch homolog protein 1-like n=1 Tax=Mya arenaria TaxID=6604 RepID=UPI0022E358F8|nr:neurogenic locus notch homolog protein 1-like [Mya arenaria]
MDIKTVLVIVVVLLEHKDLRCCGQGGSHQHVAPITHDCGHHGHWNDRHNYCECSSGYSGSKCEIAPITHDCGQHGVWSNTGHHCVCSLGYSGSKCETYVCGDHGHPSPTVLFGGHSCICDAGWSGQTCSIHNTETITTGAPKLETTTSNTGTVGATCADLDPIACQRQTNVCQDITMAELACPKTCNMC